jgi:hypothetical protein
MFAKSVFAFVAVTAFASFGLAACAAAPGAEDAADSTGTSQGEELTASVTACSVDSDCVAVVRGGCCTTGIKDAVNKDQLDAYREETACSAPTAVCAAIQVQDNRVAQCDTAAKRCTMVHVEDIQCGAFSRNSHECPSGFSCSHAGINPDLGGKCIAE